MRDLITIADEMINYIQEGHVLDEYDYWIMGKIEDIKDEYMYLEYRAPELSYLCWYSLYDIVDVPELNEEIDTIFKK
jgi:hypothetical protein